MALHDNSCEMQSQLPVLSWPGNKETTQASSPSVSPKPIGQGVY